MEQKEITIFKNIKDTSTPFFRPLSFILQRIEAGKSQKLIQKIVYVLGKPSFIYLTIDEAREDFKSCDIAFECIGWLCL